MSFNRNNLNYILIICNLLMPYFYKTGGYMKTTEKFLYGFIWVIIVGCYLYGFSKIITYIFDNSLAISLSAIVSILIFIAGYNKAIKRSGGKL